MVSRLEMTRTRINFILKGEPAQWLAQWKADGIVTSYRDAVIQAFEVFHEKIVERKLKEAQLETLRGKVFNE